MTVFAIDPAVLKDTVATVLGDKVHGLVLALGDQGAAAKHAAKIAGLDPDHLVTGLPHPSGANNERIAYFLGQKSSVALSPKTNAAKLDAARETIMEQMARLTDKGAAGRQAS